MTIEESFNKQQLFALSIPRLPFFTLPKSTFRNVFKERKSVMGKPTGIVL